MAKTGKKKGQFELKWDKVAQNGPKWPKMTQNDPTGLKNGPKRSKTPFYDLYSSRSKLTKMAQNDLKTVQNGPKHLFMTCIHFGQK